jgi:hypothetical protein
MLGALTSSMKDALANWVLDQGVKSAFMDAVKAQHHLRT